MSVIKEYLKTLVYIIGDEYQAERKFQVVKKQIFFWQLIFTNCFYKTLHKLDRNVGNHLYIFLKQKTFQILLNHLFCVIYVFLPKTNMVHYFFEVLWVMDVFFEEVWVMDVI